MAIPDFQSFFVPVLRVCADEKDHPMVELRSRIAADLKLTPEELAEKLPSGVQTVFVNRIAWSAVYLHKAGARQRVRRGVFRITERGRDILALNAPRITVQDLSRYPEFVAFHKGSSDRNPPPPEVMKDRGETPEEQLDSAYKLLRDALASDVLDALKKVSPTSFEEIVIKLLVAMGYGGSVEDAAKAVGRSGDGGVDGIIKEDKLGLDVVYVQAKRWANCVGRPAVQAFAGSLEGFRARKGVFITTSWFSQDALEYVHRIEKRIVLIDGAQLADLMIDHDMGVNVIQTYRVKRIDSDFFERE
jgi:restriction system protein